MSRMALMFTLRDGEKRLCTMWWSNTVVGLAKLLLYLDTHISSKDNVKRLADEVGSKESKEAHLLVNNAGIARDDDTRSDKAGKPAFSSSFSISEHPMQSEPEQWSVTF